MTQLLGSTATGGFADELGARVGLGSDQFIVALGVLVLFLVLLVLGASRYADFGERADAWYIGAFLTGTGWQGLVLAAQTVWPGEGSFLGTPLFARIAAHLLLGLYFSALLVASALLPRRIPRSAVARLLAILLAGQVLLSLLAGWSGAAAGSGEWRIHEPWESGFHMTFLVVAACALIACGRPKRLQHWLAFGVWVAIAGAQLARLGSAWGYTSSSLADAVERSLFVLHIPALLVLLSLRDRSRWRAAHDLLQAQYAELIGALSEIVQATEPRTLTGVASSAELAREVASRLGLDPEAADTIYRATLVRDIGKVFLDRAILDSADRPTPRGWTQIKAHPSEGARLLGRIRGLENVARLVRSHHEHWDGSGYPDGLVGEAIPLGSRIVAVVDTLDAMIGGRSYQQPRTIVEALTMIRSMSGFHFDPAVVECLEALLQQRGIPMPSWRAPLATSAATSDVIRDADSLLARRSETTP